MDRPGDVFHPDSFHPDNFQFGKPAYFDVSVRHPLQDSLICLSAATAGVAAGCGEVDKDSHHEASVWAAGGIFVPGLWSPNSLAILRVIALRTTSKSGASTALAFSNFLEELFVCLWRYNSQMLLHHLSLLPSSPLWELGG